MRHLSETAAIEKLHRLKTEFAERIKTDFEHRAKPCSSCETKGACCLDAHFVNVHITRLDAKAIGKVLDKLPEERRREVEERIQDSIIRYELCADGDTFAKTFACPLFEKQLGCLVHAEGKPLPCIHHACYENRGDVPPDTLLDEATAVVERLNERTYGKQARWIALPVALMEDQRDV